VEEFNAASAVEALVFECLERLETEGESALDSMCIAHPADAAELRQRITFLRRMGLRAGADGAFAVPQKLGDFRLIQRLGMGGMGVVYEAEQVSLRRIVALKLIRPEQLYFGNARERFRREIDAIARLQHPSIVPIFATGEEGGIPYFAMEHVRGISLAFAIDALKRTDPAHLSGRSLRDLVVASAPSGTDPAGDVFVGSWDEVATKIALALALAVQHAHERGVLHRDIKPSNVMISSDGRVVLLDFGLATSSASQSLTRTGSQIGSMPYMAPEQLRAQIERIGARTDVYAIGVTLFEMLALQPAFEDGGDTEKLRASIVAGRTQGPQDIRRGVSSDLALVCRTAMQADPADRYASAATLAEDLSNVLALRPITARAPSVVARVASWARRNPARATAFALAITLVVGGPLVFALQQRTANRRIEKANSELTAALVESQRQRTRADTERASSERNLEKAVQAVDMMLTRVGQETLRDVPQMTTVRRELLGDAQRFYAGFLAENESNADLRRAVEASRDRLSDISMLFADLPTAEKELVALLEPLRPKSAAADATDEALHAFAMISGRLGEVEGRNGKFDAAETHIREALAAFERIPVERRKAIVELRRAGSLDKLADLAGARGNAAQSEAASRAAIATSRDAFARFPDAHAFQLALGRQLDRLGSMLWRSGRADEAIAAFEESLTLLASYRKREPSDSHGREKLAAASLNYSNALAAGERFDEARARAESAVKIGEALVYDFPDVPSYSADLALSHQQLFKLDFHGNALDAAAEHLTRSLDLQQSLVREGKIVPSFSAELANGCNSLAALELKRGRPRESIAAADRGIAHITAAIEIAPKNAQWRDLARYLKNNRAIALTDALDWREAAQAIGEIETDGQERWHSARAQLFERAGRVAASDATLDAATRATESAKLRERALTELAEAVKLGRTEWTELPDPDEWKSLRDDPQFRALVEHSTKPR